MNTVSLSLVGGPPWGFRISQEDGEPPMVSQVLPEGRAYKEGMRPGDYIDGVNGEDCAFADQVHTKMRTTRGVLRLRLKRLTNNDNNRLNINKFQPLPKLKVTVDEGCSTPDSSAPPTPSSSASTNRNLNAASKPPLSFYNGGMRGSAQEKKRFFEQAIARQIQPSLQPIKHDPVKKYYASSGPPSESGTDISGYDSVSGDFFFSQTTNNDDRQTPISINGIAYDPWYNNPPMDPPRNDTKTPVSFIDNQSDFGHHLSSSRANSATPRAIEIIDGEDNNSSGGEQQQHNQQQQQQQSSSSTLTKPLWESPTDENNAIVVAADRNTASIYNENGYFYSTNNSNQNMHDNSTDSGLASSTSLSTPPAPPPPPASSQQPAKKWQVHADESPLKPAQTIKSSISTGKASGEVEVPRPQSVAELRAQIATKLEVRNPSGQKTSPLTAAEVTATKTTPAIVHQPAQAHHGKLTPSLSLLSLDRIQHGLDLMDSSGGSANASPMASTSNRQFYTEYNHSPSTSVPPFMGYDRSHSPNSSVNDTASDYSGGGGQYSNNSTLRRQHSQLLTQPEVQHAVLLHPGYSPSSTDNRNRNNGGLQSSVSMQDIPRRHNSHIYNRHSDNNYSFLSNNGQAAFDNKNNRHMETTQPKYARPVSAFGLFSEPTQSHRDKSDTPTLIGEMPSQSSKLQFNNGTTPLFSPQLQNENSQAQGPFTNSWSTTMPSENRQNFDSNISVQKLNLGNTEITAQTKIGSPILIYPPFSSNNFKDEEQQQQQRPLDSTSSPPPLSSTTTQLPSSSQKPPQSIEAASNRLAELIELAKKTFSDDNGRQIKEILWNPIKNPLNENNSTENSNLNSSSSRNLRRPHSVYELNSSETMNGYSTLPTRGSSVATRSSFRRGSSNDPDEIANAEKSAWYKSIYKQLHQAAAEPEGERTVLRYQSGDAFNSNMANMRSITPQARFEGQQQQPEIIDPQQQRRAKSVGRYDAVADMEILDRWSQQRNQFMREQQQLQQQQTQSPLPNEVTTMTTKKHPPKTAMEMLQTACSSNSLSSSPSTRPPLPAAASVQSSINNTSINSTNIAKAANSYAIASSKTQHFHLPSYRFIDEDPRPIFSTSAKSCLRCGKDRRDYTWAEIERLYEMLDKVELKKEIQRDRLGDKVKLRYIETRLEETANDLQTVIDQLEAFGKNRSKSNPEIAWKLRNSNGKFSYLTGQKPSTSGTGHAPELHENNSTNNPLTKGINEMKKMTMEEVLQRQRAEKLSEELDDQKNRRHGYFPGSSPALQNNVQRFDHFLHQETATPNNFDYPSSRCSTPARRGYSGGPIQTCTVLYKFTAQSPRELSLNRGDVVRVHREIDSNWIEGERNGHAGIFPASYVQMDEDPSTSCRNRVRVLYPFQARNRNELSLKRGEILRRRREIDANWFEGTNSKGQIGIFPKVYVQDYVEGEIGDDASAGNGIIPDRPKTPKIAATGTTNYSRAQSPSPSKKANLDRSHQIQQHEQRRQNYAGPARMVPKNAETFRALYPYKPEHSDELELQENDIVFVVEKCDDGWFIGTLLRTGQFGTFPGNYVEKH